MPGVAWGMSWSPLDASRAIKLHPRGFCVIKPVDGAEPVPLFCDLCACPNLTPDDIYAHQEHGCCSACVLRWVDARREEWGQGWRPSPDEVAAAVARRRIRPSPLPF